MRSSVRTFAVASLLAVSVGLVTVATPTVATARPHFTTLGSWAGANGHDTSSGWVKSTGISKDAWSSAVEDETVKIDKTGRSFVVEPALTTSDIALSTSSAAPVHTDIPLTDAFLLHSRPLSTKVMYLDFTGHNVTGTAWANGTTMTVPPFDADGDTTTFSDAERQTIIDSWSAVAEDYSMFDIDVTTADPGQPAIDRSSLSDQRYGVRAVITDEANAVASTCGCQGVAYVGSIGYYEAGVSPSYYSPAFAFASPSFDGKLISDVVSHEVGHNMGLSHDGTTTPPPGQSGEYYVGDGGWAPIMGAGYFEPVVQWSKGDYSHATLQEDDLAIIGSMVSYIPDDYGSSSSTATTLTLGTPVRGTISSRTDVDLFRVTPTNASLDVAVTLPSISPDLDVKITLLDSSLQTVATADPPLEVAPLPFSGLAATLTATVDPNTTYYVKIDGVGFTGSYSDYGSIGEYALTVNNGPILQMSLVPTPLVSGKAKVGKRLSVDVGTWMSGVTVAKQWLRNGNPIGGASGASYKLKSADAGKRISVRVQASMPGYTTELVTSATTKRVAR